MAKLQRGYEDQYSRFGLKFDSTRTYTLAVLPPTISTKADNASDIAGLQDFAILEILKSRNFSPVERNRIDAALKEQEFGSSGLVDRDNAARIGKLTGADALMFVTVIESKHDPFFSDSPEQRTAKLTVRIISSSTGDILYQEQDEGSSFDGELDAWQQAFALAVGKTKR
jgi:curli biogenesis system outer membrane secretion channel CsgG